MRPRSSATAKKFAIFVSVRTVAPMRPVEFDAVSSVLIGIIVTRFTGPTGPMVESHSGEPTPTPGGVIAETHPQSFAILSPLSPSAVDDQSELLIRRTFMRGGHPSGSLAGARLTRRTGPPHMRRIFLISGWLLASAITVLSLVPLQYRPVTGAAHNVEHLAI